LPHSLHVQIALADVVASFVEADLQNTECALELCANDLAHSFTSFSLPQSKTGTIIFKTSEWRSSAGEKEEERVEGKCHSAN
jgi:hypothetical protein